MLIYLHSYGGSSAMYAVDPLAEAFKVHLLIQVIVGLVVASRQDHEALLLGGKVSQ